MARRATTQTNGTKLTCESRQSKTNSTKADSTKPTASYTRVVARAITCDWVVM